MMVCYFWFIQTVVITKAYGVEIGKHKIGIVSLRPFQTERVAFAKPISAHSCTFLVLFFCCFVVVVVAAVVPKI